MCSKARLRLAVIAATAITTIAPSAHAEDNAKPQSIWDQPTLTGDWGGARTDLSNHGIDITLNYIGEAFGVLSGGVDRHGSYEGRLELSIDTDLKKLLGWNGATTHVTVYQIHNVGRTVEDNVGSISDPSGIDALSTTRLFTAWFEQSFGDRVWLRIGQLAADDEFFTSDTAGGLLNATFGWPDGLAANMLSGGPAYPLSAPAVRVKVKPTDNLTVLAAVFSGDPAGPNCNSDPQHCNRYGTTFSFAGGSLWMSELQYAVNQGKQAIGLPGVYKLGGWYATADFADQHYGLNGAGAVVSLADPSVVGPLNHSGDWGIYGIADQMVWRQGERSLNLFLRASASPSDRNLLSYYVDGGAGFKGLLPGRNDDVLTFGVAYAKISHDAIAADEDALALAPPYAVRDYEMVFELDYAAQIAPWWTVQPDIQYIVHPNGGQNPNDPTLTIGNAFVAGIRSTVKF